MKVFINFGDVRCVVPVGDGSLTVREVILLAIERYKKATSKTPNSQVTVHTLKTCRDGAILDPDDSLFDVADDREQLIAIFDEKENICEPRDNKSNLLLENMKVSINQHSILSHNIIANKNSNGTNMSSTIIQDSINYHHTHHGNNVQHSSFQHRPNVENIYDRVMKYPNHLHQQHLLNHNHLNQLNNSSINHNQTYHSHSGSISDSLISGSPLNLNLPNYSYEVISQSKSDSQVTTGPRKLSCPNTSNQPPTSRSVIVVNNFPVSKTPISYPNSTNFGPSSNAYSHKFDDERSTNECDDSVEITVDHINSYSNIPLSLHVRHGSEPNLNSFSSDETNPSLRHHQSNEGKNNHLTVVEDQSSISDTEHNRSSQIKLSNDLQNPTSKRWSTAIAIDQNYPSRLIMDHTAKAKQPLAANYEHSDEEKSFSHSVSPQSTKEEGYASEEQSNSQSESTHPATSPSGLNSPQMFQQTFARGSGRLSMLANNVDQWADAADRQLIKLRNKQEINTSNSLKVPSQNKDYFQKHQLCDSSLGSMSNSSQENENNSSRALFYVKRNQDDQIKPNCQTVIIDLTKETGPLGIHVLPDTNGSCLKNGLLIQGIEPGGRIDRDGRLNVGDTIIQVDNNSFAGIAFEKAQEIFRASLQKDLIKLSIIKSSPVFCDNANANDQDLSNAGQEVQGNNNETSNKQFLVEGEERAGQMAKIATVAATKKHSPGVNLIGYKPATSAIVIANTRRIGKKYHIQLKKGDHGLGFTITTRDNPAGGLSPIYIKTILPRGAAVQDGRLKPGDRLLEVCGIEMTGKSQEEAVRILRNLPSDSIVDLIVSRQEVEVSPSPLMPRQLPPEAANESSCSSSKEREVMTFQIPLNDTGSAGLGISVKGKTLTADGKQQDSGIFIKSVLHGGAASKDGRLKQDDQLININGITLSGKTNSEAMETLTRATIKSAHQITLTIARRICHSPTHCTDNENSSYRHQHETSILSNESYDMSFNNQLNDGAQMYSADNYSQEDSFRSSENTVIYNASNKPSFSTDSDHKNSLENPRQLTTNKSLNDSQSSLNEEQSAERFRRDGFGRQSMSEKRHAQLDAKTTDTYRRSKKNKDQSQKNKDDPTTIDDTGVSYVTEVKNNDSNDQLENRRDVIQDNDGLRTPASSGATSVKKIKSPIKNQIFSPTWCWKCQSPGSCPCRSRSELSTDNYNARMNGYQMENKISNQPKIANMANREIIIPLGLRKSCSLESLQTMMQDLQKEQLENVPVAANADDTHHRHHATTLRIGKSIPNESFRAAVDRSYDIKNYINHSNMHSVTEEGDDETISRPSTCPYRVGGGHSMTSTNYTTETNNTLTTNTDDNAQLLKSNKKKKNLFKNLFHFGSKKGRSKSMEPSATHKKDELNSYDEMKLYPADYSRKYRMEQERIDAHYRKLMEERKQQQMQLSSARPLQHQLVRNQLHPMHQSMPLSSSHRSRSGLSPRDPTQPVYAISNSTSPRDTVGVPQFMKNDKMNPYLRSLHRVHPETSVLINDNRTMGEPNNSVRPQQIENPRHLRINSQEFYGRTSMERPGSRVAVSENVNYGTYGSIINNINNTQQQRHYGTTSRVATETDKNSHHYRQLSLRTPQHHRQVSSPASAQNFYQSNQPRPVTSYFDYDHQQHHHQSVRENLFPNNNQKSFAINQRSLAAANFVNHPLHGNNEGTAYGIVGQQKQQQFPPQSIRTNQTHQNLLPTGNPIRQQQPIYQSNQVQIYGTIYNPNSVTGTTVANIHPNNSPLYNLKAHPNHQHNAHQISFS